MLFEKGTKCKIYSSKIYKWCNGVITDIFNDDEGEWLKVQYQERTLQKVCDIQRFSNGLFALFCVFMCFSYILQTTQKDIIADCCLEGIWDNGIQTIECCNVDNMIHILRNCVFMFVKNKKLQKNKEKICAYFCQNEVDGTKLKSMTATEFAGELIDFLEIKNSEKVQTAAIKTFDLLMRKFENTDSGQTKQFEDQKEGCDADKSIEGVSNNDVASMPKEEKLDERSSSTHTFSPKHFSVTFS